ncbi:winged helix-turn-helix domain-containing protein [Vibrio rumoiensis]|uniref:winged helix-turn-helix domain-containing protein n=2 Tax=Vibrio rumoiensis TaxID=76258 RepID=UPI003AA8D4FE
MHKRDEIDMDANDIEVSCGKEGGNYFINVGDVRYKCSYAESEILSTLLQNKGTFFSKEELASIGWPGKLVSKNSVPVSMANLRKIFKNHTKLDVISNEKNKGYVIIVDKVKLAKTTKAEVPQEKLSNLHIEIEQPESIEVVATTSPLGRIRTLMSKSLAYPLLVINIILFSFIFFYNQSGVEPFPVNVINSDSSLAVFTKDSDLQQRFKNANHATNTKHHSFNSIENDLELAKQENKNILFINSLGDRIIIDCLVDETLISYSGNDIEAITNELNEKGCKI